MPFEGYICILLTIYFLMQNISSSKIGTARTDKQHATHRFEIIGTFLATAVADFYFFNAISIIVFKVLLLHSFNMR